jgi:hypothetical protein
MVNVPRVALDHASTDRAAADDPAPESDARRTSSCPACADSTAPAQRTCACQHDADLGADRLIGQLRGRITEYMLKDGRALMEAHCSSAFTDHVTAVTYRVTREIAQELEAKLDRWIRDAINEASRQP